MSPASKVIESVIGTPSSSARKPEGELSEKKKKKKNAEVLKPVFVPPPRPLVNLGGDWLKKKKKCRGGDYHVSNQVTFFPFLVVILPTQLPNFNQLEYQY